MEFCEGPYEQCLKAPVLTAGHARHYTPVKCTACGARVGMARFVVDSVLVDGVASDAGMAMQGHLCPRCDPLWPGVSHVVGSEKW